MRLRYHQELSINSSDFQLESSLVSQSQERELHKPWLGRAKLGVPGALGEEASTNMWAGTGPGEELQVSCKATGQPVALGECLSCSVMNRGL